MKERKIKENSHDNIHVNPRVIRAVTMRAQANVQCYSMPSTYSGYSD